ncbi:MAG: acyl-CoA synthetase [Gammaproteobacteria bacterium]|nr:MAG: acyl-CoA synthetase [Gammaproteobacteria bacterium]PHR82267.1 MAG: acyl-CoA synthetase [Colwellia sp.]
MTQLKSVNLMDLTSIIRSKNASPFEITFDILFKNKNIYDEIKKNNAINAVILADLFCVDKEKILDVIYFDAANAIKFNMPRTVPHASFGEIDMHSAQQHVPLQKLTLEMEG